MYVSYKSEMMPCIKISNRTICEQLNAAWAHNEVEADATFEDPTFEHALLEQRTSGRPIDKTAICSGC